jgi:hypothetical protein
VFDDVPPDDLQKFADDLLVENLFRLPADYCFFQFRRDKDLDTYCVHQDGDFLLIWSAGIRDNLRDRVKGGWFAEEMFSINLVDLRTGVTARRNGGASGQENSILLYRGGVSEIDAYTTQVIHKALYLVQMGVAMLSCKGVVTDRIDVPPAVNAKRRRMGRPELFSHTLIKVHATVRACSEVVGADGRTHASPRPHFRRGHIRHLSEDKKVLVKPCFIRATGALRGSVLPTYEVSSRCSWV